MRHILRCERLGAGDVDSVVYWVTTIQMIVGRRVATLVRSPSVARPHHTATRLLSPCASTLHLQVEIEIEMTILTAGEGYAEANLRKNVAGKTVCLKRSVCFFVFIFLL